MNNKAVNVDHNFSRFIVMIHSDCKAVAADVNKNPGSISLWTATAGLLFSVNWSLCIKIILYQSWCWPKAAWFYCWRDFQQQPKQLLFCSFENNHQSQLLLPVPAAVAGRLIRRIIMSLSHNSQLVVYMSLLKKAAGLNVNPCVNYQHNKQITCILGKQDAASGTKAYRFSV